MSEAIKRPSKSDITREGLFAGLTNEQIVESINAVYPGEGKLNCVRWYRTSDPVFTGRAKTTTLKKAEIHIAFKEALNAMDAGQRSDILLGLLENNLDAFVLKVDTNELKALIPAEFLPVEAVKEPKAPKAPKEPKAKKAKKGEADAAELGLAVPEVAEI